MITCQLKSCGRKFKRPNAAGPAPKYCSAAHRQAAHVQRAYVHAGATVYVGPVKGKTQVFRTRKAATDAGAFPVTTTKLQ